jgi:hypothetical protein
MTLQLFNTTNLLVGSSNISANTTTLYNYTYTAGGNASTLLNGNVDSSISSIASFTGQGLTHIGSYGTSTYFSGTIYEVIIFNTVLTNPQRQAMEGFLAWKWGLNSNLPVAHPYSSFPPNSSSLTNQFNPLQVPGLQMWLDGADPLARGTPPPIGTVIERWSDKSGNGFNGTGVASPTYTAAGISFNGSSQYYTTTYTSFASTESIFVVYTTTNASTQSALVDTNSGGGRSFQSFSAAAGPSLSSSGVAWRIFGAYPITGGTRYIAECTYSTSGINIYVTGNLSASNNTNPAFTAGITTIGGGNSLPSWLLNGTISEVLIYNRVLSTRERQVVEGYLGWKWSVQLNLPTSHPYYSYPPTQSSLPTSFAPTQFSDLQLWLDGRDPL